LFLKQEEFGTKIFNNKLDVEKERYNGRLLDFRLRK
jgi:hypothetical protein